MSRIFISHFSASRPSERETNDDGLLTFQRTGFDALDDEVRNISPRNDPVAPFDRLCQDAIFPTCRTVGEHARADDEPIQVGLLDHLLLH